MDSQVLRDDMVDSLEHEAKAVLRTEALGLAMRTVPREYFLDEGQAPHADRPYRVDGTTAFAPSTVARLFEALDLHSNEKVLLVGAGVGYTAAIAAELVGSEHVHAIDLASGIVHVARRNLAASGYDEVLVAQGDGANGLAAYAPYDRILLEVSAVRPPHQLLAQLRSDGRLVMPMGSGRPELVAIEDGDVVDRRGPLAAPPMLVSGEEAGAIERNRMHREDRERAQLAAERRRGWEAEWIDWD